ncbi:hypothetical protein DPMN_099572 [Dreissena polymorpha]|uniref:HEPN domain-containing protein n=2 Tax=Dreissena polymorpha TaxID=45954 RepID=A0A9D4LF45_DREPO|nr:hypothetical protein DPMN_099572 [Dreissena polymorpha]
MTLELLTMIKTIYEALSIQSTPVVKEAIVCNALVWTADNFQDPAKVIVIQKEDDIELKPYMYFLPQELGSLQTFFTWLGCHSHQDENVLVSVLQFLKTKYLSRKFSQAETKKDLKCAQMILERLAEADIDSSWASDNILMVVHSNSDQTIKFAKLSECVYDDDPACFNDVVDGKSICYVHEQIPFGTVEKLGVKSVTSHSRADAQDFDHWGQRESFTTRLRSLLRDGYTDGLSVPKELLQNADDAGATEMCLVYDERKHLEFRKRLLSKSLADFQGSSLWCYNNKVFSEKDLQNIKRFNDSAKVDDLSTIGKFGLGFNAVYNITDVPSFISGSDMLIFDPHEKYLVDPQTKTTTRGKRIPLSKRTLVKRHTDQFKPFQDMFGCNVLNDPFTCYQGTLFRFPLRTAQQADMSEICQTVYSHDEVLCLLKMFIHSAEQLLLFCQNVSSIKLYHISANAASAKDMNMIYIVQKESMKLTDDKGTRVETSILARAVSVHKQQRGRCIEEHHSITIRQTFCDNATLFPKVNWPKSDVKSTWLITWALNGRPKHLEAVDTIPLVAVATRCKTEQDWTPQPLETTTEGDCESGYMFCFLPLPISTGLPFHINGCFRVSDDRQRLVLLNEDDKKSGSKSASDAWNTFLLQEPLVKALLSAIQQTQRFCHTKEDAYRLWPDNCKPDVTPFVKSFYRAVLDHNVNIFTDRGNCLPFDQILILTGDPRTAVFQEVLKFLVYVPVDKGKTVVEVPNSVCKCLQLYNKDRISIVQSAFISMIDALVHFLHNIGHKYWADKLTIRNNLLAYAITVADKEMKICFRKNPCIPTAPNGRLRTVLDLIHPHSKVSKLFSESDERFIIECESLSDPKIHAKLVEIGMNSSSLPSELVFDRCTSLGTLSRKCIICTKNRLGLLLTYLAESQMSQETVDHLQHLNILPVLQRPSEWTFTWKAETLHTEIVCSGDIKCSKHADEKCTGIVLGRPDNLFRMNCRHCVGSVHNIVDETELISPHLLNKLGVKTIEDITIFMLMEQLTTVGIEYESGKGMYTAETRNIIDKVYTELDKLTADMSKDEFNSLLDSNFGSAVETPIIEVGDVLVRVDIVAQFSIRSCPPHLYGLPKVSVSRWRILEKLGVKKYFSFTDVVRVLQFMTEENNLNIILDIKDVIYILENLVECMHRENKTYADIQEFKESIIAPDREGRFFPTYQLALEDHHMTTKTNLRLLHEDITPNIGKFIGVQSKRHQLLRQYTHAIPFGQREELTTRLNGLLKDYPPDESIMKELIQNADDAGAREIHFIKYYEERKVEKSLEKGVKLKPALCIYNDSCFTEQDFIGIQSLGIGSKSEDPSKTGQFGVGFNAVYHITDNPSFLTKGQDLGENGDVCIFDPLFTQIEDIWGGEPGLRYHVDDLKDDFPDTTLGFPEIPGTCGTMFRLPLRTQPSKISKSCLTPNNVNDMLKAFRRIMPDCLHFLKNIKRMKIRVYEGGRYVDEYMVDSEISSDTYVKRQTEFFKQVNTIVVSNANRKEDNILVKPLNVTFTMRVHDTDGVDKKWLISHQFGASWCDRTHVEHIYDIFRNEGLKLIPTGGVSLQLCSTNVKALLQGLFEHNVQEKDAKMRSKKFQVSSVTENAYRPCETSDGKLYCFLPLTQSTGLPFHVNGHFSIDRGRRGLWEKGYREEWNNFLLSSVVTEALINALKYLQKYWLDDNMDILTSKTCLKRCLTIYFSYFPRHETAKDTYWKYFVAEFYRLVIEREIPIFPEVIEEMHLVDTQHSVQMREKQFMIAWIHLTTNIQTINGGVVDTLYKLWKYHGNADDERLIKHVLGKLSIHICSISSDVVKTMETSGQKSIIKTEPSVVMNLVKERLTDVNCNIQMTVIENIEIAQSLLKYMLRWDHFDDNIEGLPLCITNDNYVKKFAKDSGVFCSTFCDLLPCSRAKFVHIGLVPFLTRGHLFECKVLERFTFQNFLNLLPNSYMPVIFCNDAGIRWLDGESNPIDPFIIYRMFAFIYNESKRLEKPSESTAIQSVFKENVHKLSTWSFLPSKKKISGGFVHMLIPIKRAYSLLLESFDDDIGPVLKRINIPSLDFDVLTNYATIDKTAVSGAVRKLISSPTKPHELLKCLHYHKLKLIKCKLTADEAMKILRIFSQSITQIHAQLGHETMQLVKQLPLFETMQSGTFVSLDHDSDVLVVTNILPSPGIREWASRQGKIIIQENSNLQDLYRYLKLPRHDRLHMYIIHILPSITHMPKSYWLSHITFIKDALLTSHLGQGLSNDQKQLIKLIKKIPFIEINGIGYRANQLFARTHPVFELMIEESRFLPREYADISWIYFLKLIGLNVRPTGDMMINFAQVVARDGAMRTSDRLIQMSNVLVLCFLGKYGDSFEDHVFTDIKTIRFVVPYVVSRCMEQIFRGHCSTNCFISFSGSCSSHFANVCWTSLPLVHCEFDAKVMKLLGIFQEPSTDSVITHCQNIFHEFKKDFDMEIMELHNKYEYVEHIYSFLFRKRDEINTTRLRDTPFILIPDETIIKASSVFIFGPVGSELRPYLYQLPEQFLCYVELFRTIGTTLGPTCLQYANVLAIIKDQFSDQELPHNVLEVVSKAVTKFFDTLCMAGDNGHKDLEKMKLLFLPNTKRIMTQSSELVIANDSVYKQALEGKCNLNMFIGFKELKIPLENEAFKHLPLHLKPRFLTEDVSETISTDTMEELNNSSVALRCENFVHSYEFYEGLCRLLKRKDVELCTNEWNTDDDEILRDTLYHVRIKEVKGLKKVLSYKGIIVQGASITTGYHVQKLQTHSQKGAPVYHVFFQTMISYTPRSSLFWLHTGLMSLIRKCTKRRLSAHSFVVLQQVLFFEESPDGIKGFLDNYGIPALETASDFILFPPVGTYVEEKFYPFMVQQMTPFREHEYRYVALEIGIGDEEDLSDARYIYAHIIEPINSDTSSLLRLKYKVNVGVQRGGIIDVPIFRLYMFVPQNNPNTSDEVALYDTEPIGSIPFDENCERIIDMLQEAFQLFEIQDRKRIIRRLLLKWHPDRNAGHEDYATRVFNFIQHCILRLERNEALNIQTYAGAPNMSVSRYWNTCVNAQSTGHVYTTGFRDNIEEYNKSNRQGRYFHGSTQRESVNSPGEYKRWIKQAKLDYQTGLTHLNLNERHSKTYNWICYNCHQACEKALKAAWFMKDANRCPRKEHRLSVISSGLDSVIATEAHSLEERLDIHGQDYFKLRYPDCVVSDEIPSEVFNKEQAEFAVATAKKIIGIVENLS